MGEPRQLHATPAIRWGRRHDYVGLVASTPWMSYLFDRGPVGDHARWLLSADRPRSTQEQVRGTERIGAWPFGFKMVASLGFRWIHVGPLTQLAGWLLTLYAVIHIMRRGDDDPIR